MKNLFKYAYSALIGVAAFTAVSCSDSYEYDGRGTWNANADYADIYFPVTSQSIELDPADPTTATIQVMRRNTNSAVSVPFKVTRNTDDVFTVGQANFAAGESTANVEVSFPNATVGTPYSLQLTLDDPSLVSSYSQDIIYDFKVTRVKWNDVGFYYDENGNKVEGWAVYTDDIINTFWGVGNPVFLTKVQERDDRPGYFRMINTYCENYPYNDPGDWDDTQDHYIFIDATNPEQVYIPERCNTGMDWGYGAIHVYSMVGLGKERGNQSYIDGNYGTYKNGKITFPNGALLIGMPGYKDFGLYGANNAGKFSLVLNPDLDLYTAKLSDYDWEMVFAGAYTSAKLGTTKDGVELYKAMRDEETEAANPGCYDRFESEYGTPYMINGPYTAGKMLYFCVKEDGTVTVPTEVEAQDLGFEAVGEEVYGRIRGAASTFTEKEITLRIVFTNKDGSVEYGTADEVLANITWTKVGTGTYTYTHYFADVDEDENPVPVEDPGYEIYQRDDKPTVFRIPNWGNGGEFQFTWDPKTNNCTVPYSHTGDVYEGYGEVFVSDYPSFISDFTYTDYPCYYDTENDIFVFNVCYHFETGTAWFGGNTEYLKVVWENAAAARKSTSAVKHNNSVSKNMATMLTATNFPSRFVAKKVNRKAIVNNPTLIK